MLVRAIEAGYAMVLPELSVQTGREIITTLGEGLD
jgi:hypothetical protein